MSVHSQCAVGAEEPASNTGQFPAAEVQIVVDNTPAAIWSCLPSGEAEFINKGWLDYLNLSVESAKGLGWASLLHPDDLDGHVRCWMESVRTGNPFEYESRFLGRDGTYRWFLARAEPVRDEAGRIQRWCGTNLDIEDRKQAEVNLHQAQAALAHVTRVLALGELAASIAHEINQPLAGVVSNGEACVRWLDREVPDIAEVRSCVERMIVDSRRAAEVVRGLRTLVKKADPTYAPLRISDVISETIPLLQRELFLHNTVLALEVGIDGPVILGDKIQLQQVVLNLAVNGIQAMGALKDRVATLTIRTAVRQDGALLVTIKDVGTGIKPEHLNRLFGAFFSTKTDGLGMGLSICRSIIEAHGGGIWAQNNSDAGATMSFWIPKLDEAHR